MKFYGRTKEIDILRKIRNNSSESAQFTLPGSVPVPF